MFPRVPNDNSHTRNDWAAAAESIGEEFGVWNPQDHLKPARPYLKPLETAFHSTAAPFRIRSQKVESTALSTLQSQSAEVGCHRYYLL